MADKERILVGIPTMSNRLTIQLQGLLDSLRVASFDPESAFYFDFTIQNGKAPVEYARNVIVGEFLRSRCDRLWFIDEDMIPDSSVVRLLHSDADIIAAQMHKFDHPNPEAGTSVGLGLCAMMRNPNGLFRPFVATPGDLAVQEVDAVGTGCTVIRRRVLEDPRMWFENVWTDSTGKTTDGNVMPETGEYAPAVFRTVRASSGFGIMGEDIDFCVRAKAIGYSVKVDLLAKCGHYKSIDIDQTGMLAMATVQRALGGVATADGKVFQFTVKDREAVAS